MRRRERITGMAALLLVAALLAATGALAASPRQIYRDYADNGRLDHAYSAADLRAAVKDAALQGYPDIASAGMAGTVTKQLGRPAGVLAAGAARQAAPLRTAGKHATLPFTGLDLALLVLGGLGLLLVGGGLRRFGESRGR